MTPDKAEELASDCAESITWNTRPLEKIDRIARAIRLGQVEAWREAEDYIKVKYRGLVGFNASDEIAGEFRAKAASLERKP